MLNSALEHYRTQRRIVVAGLLAARKARPGGPRAVAEVVALHQLAAARDAADSVPRMLREQDLADDPVGSVDITSVSGIASDGRPLDSLFAQAETRQQFDLMVATQLQDVARIAAGIAIAMRPTVTGYVRMINPGACSRCAILAGKFYRWNTGFQRHPSCSCRHVPSSEALAGDLTTDPKAYFDSLSPAEQSRIFTNKGAEAIRDGADMSQVVNVRLGLSRAGVRTGVPYVPSRGGSGVGPAPANGPDLLGFLRDAGSGKATGPGRMTPEGIYSVATDRADAIRLLRVHGYIT